MALVLATVIVAAPPQLKVTVPVKLPPPGRQALSADSVQLAPVPVPTTHARACEVGVAVGEAVGVDVPVLLSVAVAVRVGVLVGVVVGT